MAAPAFRNNRALQMMLIWLIALWVSTAIDPFNRRDWLLENVLVFAYAFLLVATYRKFAFSNASYFLFTIFISLHLVGAHYTYTQAPPGFWVQSALDLERNHYDRFVHFAFGALLGPAFREVLLGAAKVRHSWSYFLAITGIVAFGGMYELIEGAVAMIVAPQLGAAFLGTQGDAWDAQKDTSLAFTGACASMLVVWIRQRRQR